MFGTRLAPVLSITWVMYLVICRRSLVHKLLEASVNQDFRRFFVFSCMAILALSLTIVVAVSAQVISADLVGTVLDKTGAGVPGATVEAVNSETGVKYNTQANESGEYRFNNLPVGTYSVTGSSANFAATTINNFQLELNKTSTF